MELPGAVFASVCKDSFKYLTMQKLVSRQNDENLCLHGLNLVRPDGADSIISG
jgi:hypothetical protein